jgi:hypothetical protein
MESLIKKIPLTSWSVFNGDMGGWVSHCLRFGRLRRRGGGLVDEALQLGILVWVFHSGLDLLSV